MPIILFNNYKTEQEAKLAILNFKTLVRNSKNYEEIKQAGSYSDYQNSKVKPEATSNAQDNFEKEYKYLDKIQTHQEKLDFEKLSINDWQFEDLRNNAITTIQTIMERYGIQKKDIK